LGHHQAFFAICAMVHGEPALLQTVDYKGGDFFIVFDY